MSRMKDRLSDAELRHMFAMGNPDSEGNIDYKVLLDALDASRGKFNI